jgi:hypothetical protein
MTSLIDPTVPEEGNAFTRDVRNNFTIAQEEITELQTQVNLQIQQIADLQMRVTILETQLTGFITKDPPEE